MKKIYIIGACLLFAFQLSAQKGLFSSENKGKDGVIYEKEFSVDVRAMTNGYMIAGNYGKIKTYYKTQLLQFEIGTLKHAREVKQNYDFAPSLFNSTPKSFVFGKQNSFFNLNVSLGTKKYLSEKADKKGLAVGYSYVVGPSLGIVKPYYLNLFRSSDNGTNFQLSPERFSEENQALFLDPSRIYGAAAFTYGWNELSLIPGISAKAGLHLDWGAFDEMVKALEAGIMVNVYSKQMPILLSEDNRFYSVNLYLSLQFGKRW